MFKFSTFSKKYTTRTVLNLDDTSLPDEVVWLKGSNGAGKSTLMKCAAGMLTFRGDVVLANEGISLKKDAIPYRKRVNISEADPIFPSFLKGVELIQFFKKAKGGTDDQVDNLVDLLHARSFIHDRVATYSSGMNKKLSLILAFLGDPAAILLDEPLITLDQAAQRAISKLIADKSSEGCDFLISTHQELVLPSLVDVHEIMLVNGKLVTSLEY